MDAPKADPEKIAIRCPGCGQRFMVGTELKERMVECGSCEHRFRVNDEVLVRTKKFYPGERRGHALDGFSRMPKSVNTSTASFQTVQYAEEPAHRTFETTSPLRLIFGFAAAAIIVIVALMLVFGGGAGGVLYGASQSKRLMLAVFTAIVCGALLIAANPRARKRAALAAVLVAALLIAVPFVVTEGNQAAGQVVTDDTDDPRDPVVSTTPSREQELDALKQKVGYDPLARELEVSPHSAGIWLRGLQEYHRLQVRNYFVRVTGASPSSHMYPRSPDYLLVVSGATANLDELARLCERFGEVRRTVDALRLIEVEVNNESFMEGPIEKLTDSSDPAFYELNRRELESIDLERARRAVIRLGAAEPKIYRSDIVRRMQQLLGEGDDRLAGDIGKTLVTWSEQGDGSTEAVRNTVEKITAQHGEVPESLVKFLVARGDPAVIPVLDGLWLKDADIWEETYSRMGPAIEDRLLAHYPESTITHQMSLVRMLGKVGTEKSVPVLEAAREGAIDELKLLINRALEAIRARQ
ncbi:hypothetical protein [Luteolibacter marinus]|uniref:hypothetical protein n=1 Tax=Luteolibacter marinus TaxID=2776705 RepID=UPI001868A326|nr:hypothetical protein [Luteolibacter marinus]